MDAANGQPRIVGTAEAASKCAGNYTMDDATRRAWGLRGPQGAPVMHSSRTASPGPPPQTAAAAKEAEGGWNVGEGAPHADAVRPLRAAAATGAWRLPQRGGGAQRVAPLHCVIRG